VLPRIAPRGRRRINKIGEAGEDQYFPAPRLRKPADGAAARAPDTRRVQPRLRSGSALCAFGSDLDVVAWNEAAERLTGVRAREALGRPCWAVLRGTGDDGSLVCHQGCSGARLARNGWPVAEQFLTISTTQGRRRVAVETVTARHERSAVTIHLLRPAPRTAVPARAPEAVSLSPRRREVLGLLSEGLSARAIAARLRTRESTVRSHIHGVLVELDAHSQLQAVAKARRLGWV
jgi:DNA-binding CsgD family transcriptional regulator